jgi:hypothetical protein
LEHAAEALPHLAAPIANLERAARRVKLPRRCPEADEFADVQAIATGPLDPALVVDD